MSTPPRQYHEGYWYHVYARCIEGLSLFETGREREWFISKLDETYQRYRVTIGALCLMDTHYHALLKMGPVPLGKAFNGLHSSYVDYVNGQRSREGPLFWGRPGVDIILDDTYLLQVVPYIHKNPVEAGIVPDTREYEWHTDELYRSGNWAQGSLESWEFPPHFKDSDRTRIYRERMGDSIDDLPGSKGYVGKEEEWNQLEKRDADRKDRSRDRRGRRSMDEIAQEIAEESGTSVEALVEQGRRKPDVRIRQKAMFAMYQEGYGPTEIGDYFNRTAPTVAHAVKKIAKE